MYMYGVPFRVVDTCIVSNSRRGKSFMLVSMTAHKTVNVSVNIISTTHALPVCLLIQTSTRGSRDRLHDSWQPDCRCTQAELYAQRQFYRISHLEADEGGSRRDIFFAKSHADLAAIVRYRTYGMC